MKKSGYRTTLHVSLLFVMALLGVILVTAGLVFLLITVQRPDGSIVRSNWPRNFTEDFQERITFVNGTPQIDQTGMALLRENAIGLQVLDPSGHEVSSYQRPEHTADAYSLSELCRLSQAGRLEDREATAFMGAISHDGSSYPYLLYFPMKISKVTMFLNGERFASGKAVWLLLLCVSLVTILVAGVLYGIRTTRAFTRMTRAIRDISLRRYCPIQDHGAFQDLYHSLNTLDAEIRSGDQLRVQTEKQREEWIANITHDLKTPLSPIKGYAEMLQEDRSHGQELCKRYGEIILHNASYMETLINDLKLTYQLENGMLPVNLQKLNIVRFLKELVIDVLNIPEYEHRVVHFECAAESALYSFDPTLFKRAFQNLILNAFVHGMAHTEVTIRIDTTQSALKIQVSDTGEGMRPEEAARLFDRYYRGGSTQQKPEGTGLGLAIAKSIIELHGGTISVASSAGMGTTFQIAFPSVKVN